MTDAVAALSDHVIRTTCHCGAVRIAIPRQPEALTQCDCSICRRYGTLWAYYEHAEVEITCAAGATSAYSWGRKTIQFVRCNQCGCVTHWEPIVPERGARVGINARNFDPRHLGPARLRRLDGAATESYLD